MSSFSYQQTLEAIYSAAEACKWECANLRVAYQTSYESPLEVWPLEGMSVWNQTLIGHCDPIQFKDLWLYCKITIPFKRLFWPYYKSKQVSLWETFKDLHITDWTAIILNGDLFLNMKYCI